MRRLVPIALLAAPLLGCGSSSNQNPPPKDPPRVFLTVPNANVIDVGFPLTVSVDGCTKVQSIDILDHGNPVTTLSTPTNPVDVTLTKDQVSFSTGIAATLSLTAKATCDDGRSNVSQPQPGTFFPVQQVFHSNNGQLVPDFYAVEGHAPNVTFIGCNGARQLVRVDTTGKILQSLTLPFDCEPFSVITDKASNGIRWFYTPQLTPSPAYARGALAFDSNLNVTAEALDGSGAVISPKYLGVSQADGDAIVMGPSSTAQDWIFRIPHDSCVGHACAAPVWSTGQYIAAIPQGSPVINPTQGVFAPMQSDDGGGNTQFFVAQFDYSNGTSVNDPVLFQTTHAVLDPPPQIAMTISSDATRVLLPFNTVTAGQFQVDGCATNDTNCANGWVAPPSGSAFLGSVLAAAPFGAGGSYVAAIAQQNTYFIRMDTGANIGKAGLPITTTGAAVALAYQGGKGSDFYLFDGAAGGSATEMIAVDSPQNGELLRVQIPSGSLTIGLDDDGLGWMRVGNDLMELYPLTTYRALRGN